MVGSLPFGTTAPRGLPQPELIQWPLVAARDLFELKYGKALVEADRRPGTIPVYGTNGRCGSHDKALFKGPGVIVGRKGQGPLGVEWSPNDYWVIDTAYALAPLRPDIDLRYAYFLIKFIGLNHLKDGTSNPTLSRDTFGAQALPLPPLIQQRAIVDILGTLDDKIELNRRMNETLEGVARAIFKSWFVDATQAGLPKGWRKGNVEELLALSRETINPSDFPDETFDHYSIPSFDEGRLPKAETGKQIQSNKFLVAPGTVMVSKLNPRIPRVWLPNVSVKQRSVASTEFLVAIPKPGVSQEWLYALFSSEAFGDVFATLVTGTSGSHQRVKPEYLLAMDLEIPLEEQIAEYTALVKPLHERFAMNLEESRTLAALRDTLLPKLISGQLRVKDAEKLVESIA